MARVSEDVVNRFSREAGGTMLNGTVLEVQRAIEKGGTRMHKLASMRGVMARNEVSRAL